MSTIEDLQNGIQKGAMLTRREEDVSYRVGERHGSADEGENLLARGDNLSYMKWLLQQGYGGRFRLIYIDPPFFTKSKFDATITLHDEMGKAHKIKHLAYDDTFDRSLECYVENLSARLMLMKELLAEDGTIWVHLDWHSSHYVKILMDEIFGTKHFQNEIIWQYKSGGSGKRHFARKHDTILVYSKTDRYYLNVPKEKSYNRGLKPYRFKGVKEYKDEVGWYTLVNMKDIWSVDMVGRTSKERNGYATQKPLELMKRIVMAATEEGDYCGDFFCGSGSFLEAADSLNRHWVGCDSESLAVSASRKRLDGIQANYSYCPKGNTMEYGVLDLRKVMEMPLEEGGKLVTLQVRNFRPMVDYGHIALGNRDLAERIETTAPLQYIDYMMIDPEYDGRFCSRILCNGQLEDVPITTKGSFAVVAVDVFGKEYIYEERD